MKKPAQKKPRWASTKVPATRPGISVRAPARIADIVAAACWPMTRASVRLGPRQVVGWAHAGKRRLWAAPLELRPGAKLRLGEMRRWRNRVWRVSGVGYEFGRPVVHLSDPGDRYLRR